MALSRRPNTAFKGERDALGQWRDGWTWPHNATPVHDQRLHLTLHFLGEVASERLPELIDALRVPFSPFQLDFGRAALWPHGVAVLEPQAAPAPLTPWRLPAARPSPGK
jgi:2'-5' RNA ligase